MEKFLPGDIRDRIVDLMKSRKVTQAELSLRIGCSESMLSRFISGKTDKLGNESIVRIARVFNVSTDFLLGETDIPDRKNYDISELGLSVEAARNLYTQKVDPQVVSALLETPEYANTTYLVARYVDDEIAKGFAAQNQLYATHAKMTSVPEAARDIKNLQTPIYQADLTSIQNSFMKTVRSIKEEAGSNALATQKITSEITKKIYAELVKGQDKPKRKITEEDIADALATVFLNNPDVDTEQLKKLFLTMAGGILDSEKGDGLQK